jgi:hypothetical protein
MALVSLPSHCNKLFSVCFRCHIYKTSPSIISDEKVTRLALPVLMAEIQGKYGRFHPESISDYKIILPG